MKEIMSGLLSQAAEGTGESQKKQGEKGLRMGGSFFRRRSFLSLLCMLLSFCLLFSACSGSNEPKEEAEKPKVEFKGPLSENDSKAAGRAVLISVNSLESRLHLSDIETADQYQFSYDEKTVFTDAYGAAMVAEELQQGDIVDVVLSVHSRVLTQVTGCQEVFTVPDISDFDINLNKGVFSTGDKNYRISKKTIVFADGEQSRFQDIREGDRLTIKGMGHDIYVIYRGSGEGHVRIHGAESFQGGWVEIGEIIKPIENEMVLTLPEGTYQLTVSYHKYGGSKQVTVNRGRETQVDVSDLKGDLLKMGKITFSFEPVDANPVVKIDGEQKSAYMPIEIEYGVHTLEISAEGYATLYRYISVGEPMANLDIKLEAKEKKETEKKKNTASDNKTQQEKKNPADTGELKETFRAEEDDTDKGNKSGNSDTDTQKKDPGQVQEPEPSSVSSTTNQLYIDAPMGAEVFFDGSYKGVAPCHFPKVSGTHVITLMRSGYITKSYTVTLGADSSNESYTFNALEPEEHDA
ncbi:MAG: PEGA domain-containing protein [Lachnospiraceae bacterium]|nr:PEGA domain-containing protein [Lachnospiraceae bacterium]